VSFGGWLSSAFEISLCIQRELGIEPLLFRNGRSQLRHFGNQIRMPDIQLPFGVFFIHVQLGGCPRADPKHWRDYKKAGKSK